MDNEDRIIRELSEFLTIPNIASDTGNIQKNAAHLVGMLEARGIEQTCCRSAGGPVVFGKLITPEAKRTVIFYAHYDGQSGRSGSCGRMGTVRTVLRDAAIEPAESGFRCRKTARNIGRFITTIGGSTRVRPRMTIRRSWRCLCRPRRPAS